MKPDRKSADENDSPGLDAKRAKKAAAAARKARGTPAADAGAAQAKEKSTGLTKAPKRLTALS